MSRKIRTVKGTRDLLPPETAVWAEVEETARRVFSSYAYQEIRTPIVESTELFVRSVGETTDIVGKEMFTFPDRKGRSLSLRPESTASVVRAFVQNGLRDAGPLPVKLFYLGPHFRYERPQKGRYRQFHQIGAELIGDAGPESDAELLAMLVHFLEQLGFDHLTVLLHTVGDEETRSAYRERLTAYLEPHRDALGADSRRRLDENPLRVLDTKDPDERRLLVDAPRLEEVLTPSSRAHFDGVRAALDGLDIRYEVTSDLVRGLDYYTHTVFEIVSEDLGAQNAIVGGGRYDGLVEELGGPSLPAIGFAIGEDRLIEVLPESFRRSAEARPPAVVVVIDPVPVLDGMRLADSLRGAGLAVMTDFAGGSVGSALKRADKRGSEWVLLLGEDEIRADSVTCRNMKRGEQELVARRDVAAFLENGR